MSCLFAACVPGLLMVSTYGLHRLESVIHSECPSAAEIVGRIEQAARAAREKAIANGLATGPSLTAAPEPVHRLLADEPGLPTRVYLRSQPSPRPNPQFHPSEYANSV